VAGPVGNTAHFLTDDEVENLSIARGTLTPKEREIINYHIVATIKMLEALPWPKHLRHVPEYAGGHHERMDGKGYRADSRAIRCSVQARVMGIADIFEALTARDRPYKKGKTLTESLQILASSGKGATSIPTCSTCSSGARCTCATPSSSWTRTRSTASTRARFRVIAPDARAAPGGR